MKILLIAYIVLINILGLFSMGIDKRRAMKRQWRIPERSLFILAALGGSIGILVGMYLFRHKTRHLSFAIGIPVILILQLLLIGFLFSWNQKQMRSPSQAVQYELSLIQELDSDTIQSFVSYESFINSQEYSGDVSQDASEAVNLFFKKFHYTIQNEEIDGDAATVTVNITNIDTKALATDLRTEILRNSLSLYPSDDSRNLNSYQLLRDTLEKESYETTVTTAHFHLRQEGNGWVILADETLEDELVSGFITYMNDPYLLSAYTVLEVQLDALKALTAEEWMDFLGVEDVFATYNTEYYPLIDEEYISQLAGAFDYEILRCQEEGSQAEAVVRITSIDMNHVLTLYREKLLNYAAAPASIRASSEEFSNETSRLLLESLQENQETTGTDITMTFDNNGTSWDVTFDSEFTNAVMGNISEAIDTFGSINSESQAETES